MYRESFSGVCLLASSFAEVDTGWLSNAMIFIAAAAATLYYIKGATKKTPPDTEKYRHKDDCEKLCKDNVAAHEKLESEFNERMAAMSGHSASSRKALYDSVRKLSENDAAMYAKLEILIQRVSSLEAKIDRQIERQS